MSGVNIDPVLGSDCGNNELVIKPERATSNSEDGACSMNTAAHKIGNIELNVSHSGEKPIAKDSVNNSGVFVFKLVLIVQINRHWDCNGLILLMTLSKKGLMMQGEGTQQSLNGIP